MSTLEHAKQIAQTLSAAGHTAYFAGGWVRDHLLDLPSDDIDIATSATPEQVQELFDETVPVGAHFGVVMVIVDKQPFEVASFRADGLYVDGRRPAEVRYASPEEDASRRDFTVNGMFYDPVQMRIHDFVGGRSDLQAGLLRAIGNAHRRFQEDRLRMIRAVRMVARFGFQLEKQTEAAIKEHAAELYPAVAVERVWQELTKMSRYPGFSRAIRELYRLGLLEEMLPAIKGISTDELNRAAQRVLQHPAGTPCILSVMTLLNHRSLDERLQLAQFLKVSKADQDYVTFTQRGRELLPDPSADPVRLVKWLADTRSQAALPVLAVEREDATAFIQEQSARCERWQVAIERLRTKQPFLTGAHLREHGIQPGRAMGELLAAGERLAIVDGLHNPEELLKVLRKSEVWPCEQ